MNERIGNNFPRPKPGSLALPLDASRLGIVWRMPLIGIGLQQFGSGIFPHVFCQGRIRVVV